MYAQGAISHPQSPREIPLPLCCIWPAEERTGSFFCVTKVTVNSGVCGFSVIVSAEKTAEKTVRVSLETECEMVRSMAVDIQPMDLRSFFTNHLQNTVYRAAAAHIRHIACPVPAAVLKAIEVELGLALPRDATITFHRDSDG